MKISFREIIILIIEIMIKFLRIIYHGLLADVHVRGCIQNLIDCLYMLVR